jgi:hypothetical protein
MEFSHMRTWKVLFLVAALAVAPLASARAAAVGFLGTLENLSGNPLGFIGDLSMPADFSMYLQFDPSSNSSLANITGGLLTIPSLNRNFNVQGGTINVVSGGAPGTDQVQFLVDTQRSGDMAFTFTGNLGLAPGGFATQENILAAVLNNTTGFTLTFPAGTEYSGSITGIPEPGSTAALLALVMGGGAYRFRRRRQPSLDEQAS